MLNHDVKEIQIKDIYIGDNSRLEIKKEDLSDLMDSIKKQGLLQAIGVIKIPRNSKTKKKYKIVYGNRRLAAFIKLKRRAIPALILKDVKDVADEIILNLTENEHRKDIDSFEFGRYCVYLMENFSYTLKELSIVLSTTQSRIKSSVDIFKNLPSEYSGQIKTMSHSGNRSKSRNIPTTYAKRIVQMQVKYNLKKKQVKDILDLVKKDKTINNTTIGNAMYFMNRGMKVEEAFDKAREFVVKRYEFSMSKEEEKELIDKYGNLSKAIHELIYSTGKITDPRKSE